MSDTPNTPIHIMLDTETLGMGENAIILSIGAVKFDLETGVDLKDFYIDIDPQKYPGSVDISTIKFWMEQIAEGKKAPMAGILDVGAAIGMFNQWLLDACGEDTSRLVIWANGTDFDIPKLAYAYKVCGGNPPWKYNSVRDARTVYKLFPDYGLKPPEVDKHHALADARWQAEYLISMLTNLNEPRH